MTAVSSLTRCGIELEYLIAHDAHNMYLGNLQPLPPWTSLQCPIEYPYGFFWSFAEPELVAPGGWVGGGLLPGAGFDGEGVGKVILPLTLIEFDLSSLAAGVSGPTSSTVKLFDELGARATPAEHPSSKSSRSFE